MAGTRAGGLKAAARNLKQDPEFYSKIGAKGGSSGHTGGFASTSVGVDGLTGPQRAAIVGKKGGRKSRRTYRKEMSL